MDQDVEKQIKEYVQQFFYYIDYPGGSDQGFWKDEDGKYLSMMSMTSDQMKSCIDRIDTDMYRFEGCQMNPVQEKALSEIAVLAEKLKKNLEKEMGLQKTVVLEYPDLIKSAAPSGKRTGKPSVSNDQDRKVPIKTKLPRWMVERLQSEGKPGEVLETYLGLALRKKPGSDGDTPMSESPPAKAADSAIDDSKLVEAIEAILLLTRVIVTTCKRPDDSILESLGIIEKTIRKIKTDIRKSL